MQSACMRNSFLHVSHWLHDSTLYFSPTLIIQLNFDFAGKSMQQLCEAAGTLLCVLLPPLTVNSDQTRNNKVQTVVTSAALPLWVIAAVTTATGRVLGDAHWVSDTMAGACLGASLVSVTTILCSKLAAGVKQ